MTKILRVDLRQGTVAFENLKEEWQYLGGSALIAKILNREVSPAADPLAPKTILSGRVGLWRAPGPQLGRICRRQEPAHAGHQRVQPGGPAAQILDRLGIRAVIFQGAPQDKRLYGLSISKDQAALIPAEEYRGAKNYDLVGRLRKQYGEKIAVLSTGIAGERQYRGASVSFTDIFGDPSRNAARGGLGAVMGSKGLKFVMIDPAQAEPVSIADAAEFRRIVKSCGCAET